MPKKLIRKIKKFYEKKGQSPEQAEATAYKVANKMGELENRNNPKYRKARKKKATTRKRSAPRRKSSSKK